MALIINNTPLRLQLLEILQYGTVPVQLKPYLQGQLDGLDRVLQVPLAVLKVADEEFVRNINEAFLIKHLPRSLKYTKLFLPQQKR